MKSQRVIVGTFVLVLIPLLGAARPASVTSAQGQTLPVTKDIKEIELKATKYEYKPNKIEIPVNTILRLKITAEDNDHGFQIEDVKESKTEIPKGTTKTVEYRADKAGTFEFKCSKFCGMGHGRMKGSIVVK